MANAYPIFDKPLGFAPSWSRGPDGYSGRVPYRVMSSEAATALTASGLPSINAEHPDFPGSYCRTLEWEYWGGSDGDDNAPGSSIVWASYSPASPAEIVVATDGDAYSEFGVSPGQLRVRLDAANEALLEEATKESFSAELIVRRFAASLSLINQFIPLIGKANSNQVTTPDVFGLPGSGLVLAPFQLLARSFTVRPIRANLIEIALTFGLGEQKWYEVRQVRLDENGEPVGTIEQFDVQGTAAYPEALFA